MNAKNLKIFRAKKSLGQNFLKSQVALRKIIEAGEIKKDDTVLEIGPGKGALTEGLLEKAGTVVAVEKDYALFDLLKEKFSEEISQGRLVLVQGDILEFDINKLENKNYKLIANIPYNITGAILKKFLTAECQPQCMVLLVQHEVAERIVARDGKESILSISVKAYGVPKMIMKVDKRYFSPPPKVNSGVIKVSDISRKFFEENDIDEEKFWEIVKKGFAHKRKMLSGNLKGTAPLPLEAMELMGDKRAEDLSLSEWGKLVQNLCKT